jgi:hypothetical protein
LAGPIPRKYLSILHPVAYRLRLGSIPRKDRRSVAGRDQSPPSAGETRPSLRVSAPATRVLSCSKRPMMLDIMKNQAGALPRALSRRCPVRSGPVDEACNPFRKWSPCGPLCTHRTALPPGPRGCCDIASLVAYGSDPAHATFEEIVNAHGQRTSMYTSTRIRPSPARMVLPAPRTSGGQAGT